MLVNDYGWDPYFASLDSSAPSLMDQSYDWGSPSYSPSTYGTDLFGGGYNNFATPSYDFGQYGSGGGGGFMLDTWTGQVVPASQALMGQSQNPLGPTQPQSGMPQGMGQQQAPQMPGAGNQVPPSQQDVMFGLNSRQIAGGTAVLTGLIGLAGVIQKAVQGDESSRQKVTTQLAAASPEERQAIQMMMQQAQQGIDIQRQATEALVPALTRMAGGELNITPGLQQTVQQMYSPLLGNIVQQGLESARSRGFHGGANEGPAAAIMAPLMSNAQGQMAQTLLEASMGLPMSAVQGFSALGGLNQNLVNALGATTQATQRERFAQPQQTQTTSKPFQILDALGPISQTLQGVGQTLSAPAAMDNQTALTNAVLQYYQPKGLMP